MDKIFKITKREFIAYFSTPIGYVFLIIFLLLNWAFVFEKSGFLDSNNASLQIFFEMLPWVYIIFIPAVGMRLWSEERRSGSIELLLTLPVTVSQAVIGKFLAAWVFILIGLISTFSLVFTVNHLGDPDNGVIFANYLGAFLIAGSYLSLSSLISALCKNQVVSFILSVLVCFIALSLGDQTILNIVGNILNEFFGLSLPVDIFSSFSFSPYLVSIQNGIINTRDIVYFISFIVLMLFLNTKIINYNKAK